MRFPLVRHALQGQATEPAGGPCERLTALPSMILANPEWPSDNAMMIERRLHPRLNQLLDQFPAVALLGPRQVGKTTLARQLQRARPIQYLDLENPQDLAKLSDARAYLGSQDDKLVVIDEVQRAPGLFQVLRGLIDERVFKGSGAGQFLLLGSASIDLLQQSSESLAGRIAYCELAPFDLLEMDPSALDRLWLRGGFPCSVLATSDAASSEWRAQFITTYLERDIPQLGPRIPAPTLRRFWTMLAHVQGGLRNLSQLAASLGVDGKTVAAYVDLMEALLLVRRLPPYQANIGKRLVKSPKLYVRDSGLVHSLLRIEEREELLSHPIAGMSWEGFVIESLLETAPTRTEAFFYRTAVGAEIDLLLQLPKQRRWAIEIKRSSAPKVSRGFHQALIDVVPERAFVVYPGTERYPLGEGIEAIHPRDLAALLATAQ